MAKQSRAQKKTVERVMHEFKHGELKRGPRGKGGKVRNPRQAIAIALREAGSSKYESKGKNKRNLRRTKRKESRGETGLARTEGRKQLPDRGRRSTSRGRANARGGGKTRAELYREAQRRDIPGRSRMSKSQLARALGR